MTQKTVQKFPIGTVIEEPLKKRVSYKGDVFQVALQKRWILEFSKGQYVYTEKITSMFRAFQEIFREEIAKKLGFKEWILPRLLPFEVLEKFGSIKYAPKTLFHVAPFYKTNYEKQYFLDPVQSASLYYTIAKTPIRDSELPLKVFETIGGYQWRVEQLKDVHGFDKLFEYLKLEHVYIGFPEQVIECRRKQKETYRLLFNELDLLYRIVVGAPCHASPQNTIRYKKAQSLDEIPLYDFEFKIPSENKWLEVCGTCIEEDENTKAYGIHSGSGIKLWSGCSGVGLNRLVYAFLSQHGFDEKKYPTLLKKYLARVQ